MMQKKFKVEGMHCGHCRMQVDKALNAIPGVSATVTLDPPVATAEFSGAEKSIQELQQSLSEAGDYKLIEM